MQDVKKHNATDVVRVGGATYTTNLLRNEGIHVVVSIIFIVANKNKIQNNTVIQHNNMQFNCFETDYRFFFKMACHDNVANLLIIFDLTL